MQHLNYHLYNSTRSSHICNDLKLLASFLGKSVGLLSKHNPRSLLFYTRFGVHTFGLKQPIDILILDQQSCVKALKKDLAPFRFFFWNPLYKTVIELPAGSIKKSHTRLGDQLQIT